MSPPRGLTADEAALWAKVAATVDPLSPREWEVPPPEQPPAAKRPGPPSRPQPVRSAPPARLAQKAPPSPPPRRTNTLDASWDRKLAKAGIEPDFTLDLHGHTLDSAYHRLHDGMAQARAMGARLVLVVTGKPRPVDAADRGTSRGAIRAKLLDWLAAGPHGDAVAAIRKAHRRHGGEGALYLVLRR